MRKGKPEQLDLKKNWLRIEMSYESGQRAFKTIELRSFKPKLEIQLLYSQISVVYPIIPGKITYQYFLITRLRS